jgi:hypothetical protein
MAMSCLKCDGTIPPERRPDSAYCSASCKEAARLERKRLQTRLLRLETGLSNARLFRFPRVQIRHIEGEIATIEARLRTLLGG